MLECNVKFVESQLHDCGIVYEPEKTYLLCVMTKSDSEISKIESVVTEVSRLTYEEVRRLEVGSKSTN